MWEIYKWEDNNYVYLNDASCEAQKWIALAQGYAHW